jgi:hypothetical protein
MLDVARRFTLRTGRWYSWQMLPGYVVNNEFRPYYSPIYVEVVTPLNTGKSVVRIKFLNAAYASGVQYFEMTFQVLKRADSYMILEIVEDAGPCQRYAVIGGIDVDWLRDNFGGWYEKNPPGLAADPYQADVQRYLDSRFRRGLPR